MITYFKEAIEQTLLHWPDFESSSQPITEATHLPELNEIPQPLKSAMQYSLLLPGKRLRPILLLLAYQLISDDWENVIHFACAVEMIHAYSLIHDDLPALDNDEFRRGKPTNHRVYGENMAILAGDGLLNYAYETMLSSPICRRNPSQALKAIAEISRRAGVKGMIAGQVLDVKSEGKSLDAKKLLYIHTHKTADLITAPLVAGILLANGSKDEVCAITTYGTQLGLAFQIIDDILDIQGDSSLLGKQTGMDEARGKQTWPALFGLEQAKQDATSCVEKAISALSIFGSNASDLKELATNMLSRTN